MGMRPDTWIYQYQCRLPQLISVYFEMKKGNDANGDRANAGLGHRKVRFGT